jgi:hypothetical protein
VGSKTLPLVLSWALGGLRVFVDEAAQDGPASDLLLGQAGHGVIGPGRAKLAAAMGPSPVVVGLVPGQGRPQVSFAGGQHRVDDLGPGGEHNRSAQAFARGLRGGISTASMPALARTASKDTVNCPARSRTRNRQYKR